MSLVQARHSLVKTKVQEVLKENFITQPPIDIRNLVQSVYGLKLQYAKFSNNDVCGFLDINEKTIWVNVTDNTNRQNFTIAHEFGHWMLHKDEILENPESYNGFFRQPLGGCKDYRETEANMFAAQLLVPKEMLKICCTAKFTTEMMARLFQVSEDVIGYRLKQEGLND